ncbi:hypothetical protein [Altererythrobacter lutimaris]|uniref:Capsule biosynthesis protein n=1 Tax=Altererythrobacter lutimaris TaxID=2743979 RepID=A0A850HBN1_9SPHN|nr:hypothetical protein [Altererythrobacter lutimaris]NVE94950.1 hypothetical protein [Altererythrobacter lutimaris]
MMERLKAVSPLFLAIVALPTLLAMVYFGLLAEDIYVSESRIVVSSTTKSSASPIDAVLGSTGISTSNQESDAVTEYVMSRDALEAVNADGLVREAYGNPAIFALDRFGWPIGDSFEHLYSYFSGKVMIQPGDSQRVLRLSVEAYTPEHAREINERLLKGAEQLVNDLSNRARSDAIEFSEGQVVEAREKARAASLALARFRDQQEVIDPQLQAQVGLQTIAQLQDQLTAARTQLQQMQAYTPRASQIPFLRTQIAQLEREIDAQTAKIAGGKESLSTNAARFQELTLASEFAEQQLAIALASLQEAQAEARRQQAYVERISEPSLPDFAIYPQRLRNIFATLVLGLLAWGVIAMLLVGIKEHRE